MILLLAIHIVTAQISHHEDCVAYSPQTIRVEPTASGWWMLADGRHKMQIFATQQEAQNGLALASRYTRQCFIGRHASTRPNVSAREQRRYIVTYWKGPTAEQTTISPETCQPYVGSALRTEDKGAAGWLVTDDKSFQIPVDNSVDAKGLISLARRYATHCAIGRQDADWPLGRVDYWK